MSITMAACWIPLSGTLIAVIRFLLRYRYSKSIALQFILPHILIMAKRAEGG